MAQERVQKLLAQAGIASRRKAEQMIALGQVTINGKLAALGDKAEWGKDAIKVDGKLLLSKEAPLYVAFNKPRAVISMMSDPENRTTLADFFGKIKARLFPIGRLDFNSDGLLLLTNDGDFAERLAKKDDVPRVYQVKVKGRLEPSTLSRLEKGGKLGDRFVKPHSVRVDSEMTSKSKVEIVIIGGGAIDIKALFEQKGLLVEKVTRTAIGHLTLKGLEPGGFRYLKSSQVEALLTQPELAMTKIERAAAKPVVSAVRRNDSKREEGFRDADTRKTGFGRGDRRDMTQPGARRTKHEDRAPEGRPEREGARPSRDSARPMRRGARPEAGDKRGYPARGPRMESAGFGGDKRPGGFKRGPRPEGAGFGGADRDSKPRGGFKSRVPSGNEDTYSPKPRGGFGARGPRADGDKPRGGFGARGPRADGDKPRGGFGSRAPRATGGFGGKPRTPRPKR